MRSKLAPKERPMPFTDAMVRAILDGRKTMTRRVVKTRIPFDAPRIIRCHELDADDGGGYGFYDDDGGVHACPYGKPGDRLWVRETWAKVPETAYWHDQTIPHKVHREEDGYGWWAVYRASWERCAPSWKSPLFMPRWASRIILEIVSVRVERVQDISEEDACSEGVDRLVLSPTEINWMPVHSMTSYYWGEFKVLWESIKGKGSWDANPWVWVIEFKVVQE